MSAKPKTFHEKHLKTLQPEQVEANEHLPPKPQFRWECANVPRPCPYVSCRYNMYLDVTRAGSLKLNFPDREPGDIPADRSCALDMAEVGGMTLEEVAKCLNMTRERVRQLEEHAVWQIGEHEHMRAAGSILRQNPWLFKD